MRVAEERIFYVASAAAAVLPLDDEISGEFIYRVKGAPGSFRVIKNTQKILNIMYSNVDSLLNKKQELEIALKSFKIKPSIILLTVVNYKNKDINYEINELNIPGYACVVLFIG